MILKTVEGEQYEFPTAFDMIESFGGGSFGGGSTRLYLGQNNVLEMNTEELERLENVILAARARRLAAAGKAKVSPEDEAKARALFAKWGVTPSLATEADLWWALANARSEGRAEGSLPEQRPPSKDR